MIVAVMTISGVYLYERREKKDFQKNFLLRTRN
jgi:hypothetical protein